MGDNSQIWKLNLAGYSKIAQQYYCELHRKRPQALLGVTNFVLPYEINEQCQLCVKREYFKRLASLVRERVIKDPEYVNQLIASRRNRLEILKQNLSMETVKLCSGDISSCKPLQTFSYLTDFACFYIEYNFPYSLFKELLVNQLGYSEEEYESIRLRLLTPYESAYLTYYRAILEFALKKLSNVEVDLWSFNYQYSCIGIRDLKSRSDAELENAIQRIIFMFESRSQIRYEIMRVRAVEQKAKAEHAKIKQELLLKCQNQGNNVDGNLVIRLVDMLIEAALENEQTSIWRGRVFAYLKCLIEKVEVNPCTVSIEELQSQINKITGC